jgi:hypothetical protein
MSQFVHLTESKPSMCCRSPQSVDFIEGHETRTLVFLLIGLPPTAIVAFLARVWRSGALIDVGVAATDLAGIDIGMSPHGISPVVSTAIASAIVEE